MRKNNRKGFTIVELVIVIAVIAILAGVLIPTFASIIEKAQVSAAEQTFMSVYKEGYALAIADDGVITEGEAKTVNTNYTVKFDTANSSNATITTTVSGGVHGYISATVTNGKITVSKN